MLNDLLIKLVGSASDVAIAWLILRAMFKIIEIIEVKNARQLALMEGRHQAERLKDTAEIAFLKGKKQQG